MAFDLASVLQNAVEIRDAGRKETIEYIPLDNLDPDPMNFYELRDLDSLAESIELLGLQQPIRVRAGEDGHFTVVSGHRRRAACMMIRDGGSDMFDNGVPCIREMTAGSAALNELKLIYANSTTRVLSPSEVSKQAERVTELLYQLKEEGIDFPGRMRKHVAQACNISSAKLGRLHSIRENLIGGLLKHFDSGDLSETAAYSLQKLPEKFQTAILERAEQKKVFRINSSCVDNILNRFESFEKPITCKETGSPCEYNLARCAETACQEYSWHECSVCCCRCTRLQTCSHCCVYAKNEKLNEKAKENLEKERSRERIEKQNEKNRKLVQMEASRIVELIDRAGIDDSDFIEGLNRTAGSVRLMADGNMGKYDTTYSSSILPRYYDGMTALCRKLNCSLDFLYGDGTGKAVSSLDTEQTEAEPVSSLDTEQTGAEPVSRLDTEQTKAEPVSSLDTGLTDIPRPRWFEGEPEWEGKYTAKVECGGSSKLTSTLYYSGGEWYMFKLSPYASGAIRNDNKLDESCKVTCWWPLPED